MDQLRHRRAEAALRLLKPDGTPAAHLPVRVCQLSHQFLFGCGAFDALPLTNTRDETEKAVLRERMEKWLLLFNYGTIPFYWGRYEPVEGRPAFAETMAAASWLRKNGVRVKGHPLCWHTVCADWLMQYPNDEILRRQLARVRREATAYRGVVDMWDVINEVVIMPVFDKYDNAITRICRELGRTPLVKAVFEAARESNPDAVLLINDFNTSPAYEHLLEELLDAGVPIGAIGIQSHQHQGYWGREKLEDVLARFSRFGLPLHFTENTLISGELMPAYIEDLNDWQVDSWPSTLEGEERQAREMTEMYSVLFAHPQVEAITAWDFIDGGWLKAPCGLLRADGSEKPAFRALRKLIREDWSTQEELCTDAEGFLRFTGFRGGYALRSMEGDAEFELTGPLDAELRLSR